MRAVRRALPRSRLCFQSWMVVLSGIVSAILNRRAGRRAVGRPGGEMADGSLDAQGAGPGIVADRIQRAGPDFPQGHAQDWLISIEKSNLTPRYYLTIGLIV